jgi:hypothetical protein
MQGGKLTAYSGALLPGKLYQLNIELRARSLHGGIAVDNPTLRRRTAYLGENALHGGIAVDDPVLRRRTAYLGVQASAPLPFLNPSRSTTGYQSSVFVSRVGRMASPTIISGPSYPSDWPMYNKNEWIQKIGYLSQQLASRFGVRVTAAQIKGNTLMMQFRVEGVQAHSPILGASIIAVLPELLVLVGIAAIGIGLFAVVAYAPTWSIILIAVGAAILLFPAAAKAFGHRK